MKKIIYLVLTVSFSSTYAQYGMFSKNPIINKETFDEQRVHFGYFLGFNSFDFKFDYKSPQKDLVVNNSAGFNVGLVANLRINKYVDFRFEPGLYFTQRDLVFEQFELKKDRLREIKSTYISFPFLLKFSAKRTGNIKPYLIGGLSKNLNLASYQDSSDDNSSGRFRMKKWNNAYELGFGIDFYFEYFKFSPSIRGVFGISDELVQDKDPNSPWTSNTQNMQTRGIVLNFAFH